MDIAVSRKLANMSFFCALLVVVIHVGTPRPVGSAAWWLYAGLSFRGIANPFFFLMSGYLLAGHMDEDGWWERENLKRVRTLLVPYVLWETLWQLFLLSRKLCGNMLNGENLSTGMSTIIFSKKFLGLNLFDSPQLPTLWYVRALLIFVFVSPLLVKLLKKNVALVLGLSLFAYLIFGIETFASWHYFFSRTVSVGFVFFFLLGILLRKRWCSLVCVKNERFSWLNVVLLVCMVCAWGGGGAIITATYGDHGLPTHLNWMVNSVMTRLGNLFFIYLLWQIMPEKALPPIFSKMAFPIYLVHWFVLFGGWKSYVGSFPKSVCELALSLAVGIFGSIGIVWLMRKIFPASSSVLFGGR